MSTRPGASDLIHMGLSWLISPLNTPHTAINESRPAHETGKVANQSGGERENGFHNEYLAVHKSCSVPHPPRCLHPGSRYFSVLCLISAGLIVPGRCVVHFGCVWTGVEGVGEGQEAGQAPRNLSFFTQLRPSPPPRQFLSHFSSFKMLYVHFRNNQVYSGVPWGAGVQWVEIRGRWGHRRALNEGNSR